MKIYHIVSEHCVVFVLQVKGHRFLFGLPSHPSLLFLDESTIDAVFLSDHESVQRLPQYHFECPVFASEPSLAFGELGLLEAGDSRERAREGLQRVTKVSFGQEWEISGGTARAVSSGLVLGASNWLLKQQGRNIGLLCHGSHFSGRLCAAMDQSVLRGPQLVVSGLPLSPPQDLQRARGDLRSLVQGTLQSGGSVMFPMAIAGLFFDVVDVLLPVCGAANTPIYVLARWGEAALANANILSEYCSDGKRAKAYNADNPLSYSVQFVSSAHHLPLQQKYVLFTPHADQAIPLLANDARNAVVLCDPLSRYGKTMMESAGKAQVRSIPIDFSLSDYQAEKMCDAQHFLSLNRMEDKEIRVKLSKQSTLSKRVKSNALTGEGTFTLTSHTLAQVDVGGGSKSSSLEGIVKDLKRAGLKLIHCAAAYDSTVLTFPTLPGCSVVIEHKARRTVVKADSLQSHDFLSQALTSK